MTGLVHLDSGSLGDTIPTTNTADVQGYSVGQGGLYMWLDAAITPYNISSTDAPRVPDVIKSVLESTGAITKTVEWGNAADGTDGKVHVVWQPDKTYNAVDYANIAVRIFAAAADQFASGAELVMPRYRINRILLTDYYVYPTGAALPANAPELALSTVPGDLTPTAPVNEGLFPNPLNGGLPTWAIPVAVGGGVVVVAGGTLWWMSHRNRRKIGKNRRRSARRRSYR